MQTPRLNSNEPVRRIASEGDLPPPTLDRITSNADVFMVRADSVDAMSPGLEKKNSLPEFAQLNSEIISSNPFPASISISTSMQYDMPNNRLVYIVFLIIF